MSQIAMQHRLGRRSRAAQLARAAARSPAARGSAGPSPLPRSAPAPTSSGTRCGCTTASAARSAWASRCCRQPRRRAARLLGRARHALGAALERPEHGPERACAACSARSSGFVVGAALVVLVGTNTTLLWVLLPPAVLFAGLAPAAISFAAGQAAFTLDTADPLQHAGARGLADRAGAHRGRRARRRGEPRGRAAVLAARRRRRARPGAGRRLRRQRGATSRARSRGSAWALRLGCAVARPRRPRRRRAPRQPPGGWTTPFAATSPSAAPSRCRSPRSPAWSPAWWACVWRATPCSSCGVSDGVGRRRPDGGATGAVREHASR